MIYADVVMVLNFLVDFLLLLGTNRLAGFPPEPGRAAMAAALGAVYSGACLLRGLGFLGSLLWRGVFLGLMAVIAFGWNRSAVQRGMVFLLLSMALGGAVMGVGNVDMTVLILAAAGLWLVCRHGLSRLGVRTYIPVKLRFGDREVKLLALRDTGNTLRDPVTGEQVMVAGADVAGELLDLTREQLAHPVETLAAGALPGGRLVPYSAVGQPAGMLLAIRFPNTIIGNRYQNTTVAFAPQVLDEGKVYRILTGGGESWNF